MFNLIEGSDVVHRDKVAIISTQKCDSVQITIGDMGSLKHGYECNSVQITNGDMGPPMHAY